MGGVAASGFETGEDSVGWGIEGGNEDDGSLWARGTIGERMTGGDAGGEMEGEKGKAEAGGAVEECKVCEGDTVQPKPREGPRGNGGEGNARGRLVMVGSEEWIRVEGGIHGEGSFLRRVGRG